MVKYYDMTSITDKVKETTKATSGFFTGGVTALAGSNFTTASLGASQKDYYYTIQYSNINVS